MDAPIGYSGAPYVPNRSSHLHDDSTRFISSEIKENEIKLQLNQFPLEILLIIASSLSQFEILNLLMVNKSFYNIFKPFLYHHIIIDSSFSEFNSIEISIINKTFIKTSYSLKLFLKKIVINKDDISSFILSLTCNKLPTDIIQIQLYDYLQQIFPTLINLKDLNWYNSNDIDFKLLNKLPSPLRKLYMNTKLPYNLRVPNTPSTNLDSIVSFAFTPFQNSDNLIKIASFFNFQNLQDLKVSRLFNKESLLIPPSNSLVTTEDILDLDINTLSVIFNQSRARLKLQKLSIDGVLIQPSDFHKLHQSTDLTHLKHLELSNISELVKINIQNLTVLESLRHNTLELSQELKTTLHSLIEPNFLTCLTKPHLLKNLTTLKIDVRQGLVDSTPTLISSLHNLKNLDIISRWNNTKIFQFQNFDENINELVSSISLHSETLQTLSLELRLENTLINNESLYTLPNLQLEKFCNDFYPMLTGLRMNVLSNFLLSNNSMISSSHFPSLKYLNLFGDDIYNKHMGLEVINPGILDDFFKIQHVVVNLLRELKTNLQYIMIDLDKVFEIEYGTNDNYEKYMVDLVPRDGINDWFKGKVRVIF